MTNERYQELLKDKSVIKIKKREIRYFASENRKVSIEFLFSHRGEDCTTTVERINLRAFPYNNLIPELEPSSEIGKETIIMVNSDSANYAMSFKLLINEEDSKVTVLLHEKPLHGEELITIEEREGIEVKIK